MVDQAGRVRYHRQLDASSLYPQDKALKVFTFGVVYAYRVIRGLRKLVENANPPSGIGGGNKQGFSEILSGDNL